MKHLSIFLIAVFYTFMVSGCADISSALISEVISSIEVSDPNPSTISDDSQITFSEIAVISDIAGAPGQLLVDDRTNIVYLYTHNHYGNGITPYLAPNGQPYTYDADLNAIAPVQAYPDEVISTDWIISFSEPDTE